MAAVAIRGSGGRGRATSAHVAKDEVREVFSNRPYFRFVEKGHRSGESVYAAMGQTDGDRYVIVFFIYT